MHAFVPPSAAHLALRHASARSPFPPTKSPRPSTAPRCSTTPLTALKLNKLGSSDLLVTEACLGTMTWGTQNTESDAVQQLDYALKERAINFIDTAEMYPVPSSAPGWVPGNTEAYIGRYFAKNPGLREKLVVATKIIGYTRNSQCVAARYPDRTFKDNKRPDSRHDPQSIVDACNASLRRLQTDYIDLYQLHWPDRYAPIFGPRAYDPSLERDSIPFKEILTGMKQLLDAGKIRAYGLSNETTYGVSQFVRAADELGMPRPVSIQNNFCLFNRSFEGELAEACAPSNYDIGLLPYSVLGGGSLSGKYIGKLDENGNTSDPRLKRTRFILYKYFQQRFTTEKAVEAIKKYGKIADEAGMSLATLAQAFCKTRYYIPSTIIAATNMEQLEENIDALDVDLGPEILGKIDEVQRSNKDVAMWP